VRSHLLDERDGQAFWEDAHLPLSKMREGDRSVSRLDEAKWLLDDSLLTHEDDAEADSEWSCVLSEGDAATIANLIFFGDSAVSHSRQSRRLSYAPTGGMR
jgi:hypothetical protein